MSEEIKEKIKAYYIANDIDKVLDYIQQKEKIIKEVREEIRIYEEQSNDGTTNELDNYVFVQRLKKVLDKENK